MLLTLDRAAWLAALAFLAAACCDGVLCGLCAPALSVSVTDAATGEPIPSATAADGFCDALGSCGWSNGPGSYGVELSAPGYETRSLEATVPESEGDSCCDCGFVPQREEIALTFVGCNPGETSVCRCPHDGDPADDGQEGSQTCNGAGDGWLPCETPAGACR
jgi:hypothetical protein